VDEDRERSLNARIARRARATEDPHLMSSAARAARLERLRAQVTAENPRPPRGRALRPALDQRPHGPDEKAPLGRQAGEAPGQGRNRG
jgi:hypothetical protein